MTAQISDTFIFQGREYGLIGESGGDLASPQRFGIKPISVCNSCYRGYYATYELTNEALYLRELSLFSENDYYPPIQGITPVKYGEYDYYTYEGLSLKMNFTRKMRLARGFIQKYYVHMGYQKATAFETVLDITLKGGRILEIKDRSEEMAQKRGAFKSRFHSGNILQTNAEAFSLDLDLE
jgi:hypothetical protein